MIKAVLEPVNELFGNVKAIGGATAFIAVLLILITVGIIPSSASRGTESLKVSLANHRAASDRHIGDTQRLLDHAAIQTELIGLQCLAYAKALRDPVLSQDCSRNMEAARRIDRTHVDRDTTTAESTQ